jgi:excisionase family DNA binding protein
MSSFDLHHIYLTMQNLLLLTETDLRTLLSETFRKELEVLNQETKPQENILLTRVETAKKLGISLPTLISYTNQGRLQSYRIGSRIRYKKEEVENSLSKIQSQKFR